MSDEDVPELLREIGEATNDLEAIILVDLYLQGPGVPLLLPLMMTVYWVNLRNNPLNDEGVDVLTELVSTSKTILCVDFTANHCSLDALMRYMDALITAPSLKRTLIQTTRYETEACERRLKVIMMSTEIEKITIVGNPYRTVDWNAYTRLCYWVVYSPTYETCRAGCYQTGGTHPREMPLKCRCPMPGGRNNAYHEMEAFLDGSRNEKGPLRKFFNECGDRALLVRILRCMIGLRQDRGDFDA